MFNKINNHDNKNHFTMVLVVMIILFQFNSTPILSQTWEKLIDTPSNEFSPTVSNWGNKIIVAYTDADLINANFTLLFLNQSGSELDKQKVTVPSLYNPVYLSKTAIINDSLFALGIVSNKATNNNDISFIQYDLTTDLYSISIYPSVDTSERILDYIVTDSSFIVPGWANVNNQLIGYILEISRKGSLLKKQYTGQIRSLSGFLWNDNHQISTRFVSNYTYTFNRSTFIVSDSTITSPLSSSLGGALTSSFNSGTHYLGGYFYDSQQSLFQCEVLKITNDSLLSHNYRFGRIGKENKIQGVQPIAESDSNILFLVGSTADDVDPIFRADPTEIALFKTNQNGDTLFMKFYKGDVKYIANSIIATPDGGALIASYKYDWHSPYPNQWDIHLLKVDSLGNYIPMSVNEPNLSVLEPIIIYPNPARHQITVSGVINYPASFTIFDITGREIKTVNLTQNNQKVSLITLSKGAYIYKVNAPNRIESGKLIVR